MKQTNPHIISSAFSSELVKLLNLPMEDLVRFSMQALNAMRNEMLESQTEDQRQNQLNTNSNLSHILAEISAAIGTTKEYLTDLNTVITRHADAQEMWLIQAQPKERFITLPTDDFLLKTVKRIKRKMLWRASHDKTEMSSWNYVMKSVIRYKKRYKQRINIPNLINEHFQGAIGQQYLRNQAAIFRLGSKFAAELGYLISLIEIYNAQERLDETKTLSRDKIKQEMLDFAKDLHSCKATFESANTAFVNNVEAAFVQKLEIASTVEYPPLLYSKATNWTASQWHNLQSQLVGKIQSRTARKSILKAQFANAVYVIKGSFEIAQLQFHQDWETRISEIELSGKRFENELFSSEKITRELLTAKTEDLQDHRIKMSEARTLAALKNMYIEEGEIEKWVPVDIFMDFKQLKTVGLFGTSVNRYAKIHLVKPWNENVSVLQALYVNQLAKMHRALDVYEYYLDERIEQWDESISEHNVLAEKLNASNEQFMVELERYALISTKISAIIASFDTKLQNDILFDKKAVSGARTEWEHSKEQFAEIWSDVESFGAKIPKTIGSGLRELRTVLLDVDAARLNHNVKIAEPSSALKILSFEVNKQIEAKLEARKWKYYQPDFELFWAIDEQIKTKQSRAVTISAPSQFGKTSFLSYLKHELGDSLEFIAYETNATSSMETFLEWARMLEEKESKILLIDDFEQLFSAAKSRELGLMLYQEFLSEPESFQMIIQTANTTFVNQWSTEYPHIFGEMNSFTPFTQERKAQLNVKLEVILDLTIDAQKLATLWDAVKGCPGLFVRACTSCSTSGWEVVTIPVESRDELLFNQLKFFKQMSIETLAQNCLLSTFEVRSSLNSLIKSGALETKAGDYFISHRSIEFIPLIQS